MKTPAKQSKFNGGEISPLLYGDTTVPKYGASVRTALNWLPVAQGPLLSRPGTRYVGATLNNAAARIKGVTMPDGRSYLLEFTNSTLRVWKAGVLLAGTIATPWTAAMLPYLKMVQAGHVVTVCYGGQAAGDVGITPQDLRHTPASDTWTISATFTNAPSFAVGSPGGPGVLCYGNGQDGQAVNSLPAWSATTTYQIGSRVSKGSKNYISLQNSNLNQDPASVAVYWQPSVDNTHSGIPISYGLTHVFRDNTTGITYESGFVGQTGTLNDALSADRPLSLQTYPGTPTNANYQILFSRLYRGNNGVWGFITNLDTSNGNNPYYVDLGAAPDYTQQPPVGTNPFLVSGSGGSVVSNYPALSSYYEQRRYYARSLAQPQAVWASKVGNLYNFDRPYPGSDADSLFFIIASEVLEEVRSFAPLRVALILTGNGEWTLNGGQGGAVSRSSYSFKRQSKWGSSWRDPVVIGNGIVFNTAKSNMVRDLYPLYGTYTDIWDGDDLTYQARHLFDGYTLVDWDYQATPYSVIWGARSDGTLLSLTYYRTSRNSIAEVQAPVVAWAQHVVAQGAVENVAVVTEGSEDAVYLVVRRTVNGSTVRYIERLTNPIRPSDVRFDVALDASLTFDNRVLNTGSIMLLSGGTTYAVGDRVNCGCSDFVFSASDVGKSAIVFNPDEVQPDGRLGVTCRIVAYTDPLNVTVELGATLTPAQKLAWASNACATWAIARSVISVPHLTGYALDSGDVNGARGVTALADGAAVDLTNATFSGGTLTLPAPASVVTVGLAYNSDLVLLDAYHPNAEIRNKFKSLLRLGFQVASSRALWVGRDLLTLYPWVQRDIADGYGLIPDATGYYEADVADDWNKDGSAAVRRWEPLSATILSVLREMELGGA